MTGFSVGWRVWVAGACLAVATFVALTSFAAGYYPFGNANDDDLCRLTEPLPAVGGPYDAPDSQANSHHTLMPLGVVCELNSQHDSVGPQTTHHQNPTATVVWLVSSVIAFVALFALILLLAELRRLRKAHTARYFHTSSS